MYHDQPAILIYRVDVLTISRVIALVERVVALALVNVLSEFAAVFALVAGFGAVLALVATFSEFAAILTGLSGFAPVFSFPLRVCSRNLRVGAADIRVGARPHVSSFIKRKNYPFYDFTCTGGYRVFYGERY